MEFGTPNLSLTTPGARRPKVGVVLGSGGIKAFAALALFEFLDQHQIPVDFLAGCSGGGLMAAVRGIGFSAPQTQALMDQFLKRELFSQVDYQTFLGMARLPLGRFDKSSGLLKSDRLRQALHSSFGERRLEELQPETVIQTTDVLTGEGVTLSQGLLADAVYASIAGFPLLPPAQIDGRWLVDGAFSASLPVLEAVNRGIDVILAVAFRQHLNDGEPPNFFEHVTAFMGRTTNINEMRELSLAIDLHHYEIVLIDIHFDRVIQMWHVDAMPTILETGRRAVAAKQGAILSAIANFGR
jgi:NTE family protein